MGPVPTVGNALGPDALITEPSDSFSIIGKSMGWLGGAEGSRGSFSIVGKAISSISAIEDDGEASLSVSKESVDSL